MNINEPIEHPLDRDWLELHREIQVHPILPPSLDAMWDLERFTEAMARVDQ